MTALPPTSRRRLTKIPQTAKVWEGDRRSLGIMASHFEGKIDAEGECIIWVDGTEGSVRAMDVVSPQMGIEAVVRTLLRAIEAPHHPLQPVRPQKIIVRDREIQFFLRGALQGLDINIEYVPHLPLIDSLFEGFAEMNHSRFPPLPSPYNTLLKTSAAKLWQAAPWELLTECDVFLLEFKGCDLTPLYVCVMGMMSAQYGVIFYRSLESLKQFRITALEAEQSVEMLESAFLSQDCWFLNYEEEEENESKDIIQFAPVFGSLHPYEGLRSFLDEEEAQIVYVALETLLRFYQKNRLQLESQITKEISSTEDAVIEPQGSVPKISKSFRINLPETDLTRKSISTKISTLPDLVAELSAMNSIRETTEFDDTAEIDIPIQEDLIPDGSFITLNSIKWELIEKFKGQKQTYSQSLNIKPKSAKIPAIFVQTTRSKAKTLIESIKNLGGLKAVCFNPGQDPYSGEVYDLGMLQTGNGELYIFNEYCQDIPQQAQIIKRWQQLCQQTRGFCGVIVAMAGNRHNCGSPESKHVLAVFETQAINGEELGIGILQLIPNFEF